jgi:hypothetical protein
MKIRTLLLALFAISAAPALAAASGTPLAGAWKLDPDRSADPSSWRDILLTIAADGDNVTITRKYTTGNRSASEVIALDMKKPVNIVPVAWWPDNRYIGVYIGGDKTRTVRASWVDRKRILRLDSDLVLATQQGDTTVNILSDYKVSHDGRELTLVELRGSRRAPMVYVFNRIEK